MFHLNISAMHFVYVSIPSKTANFTKATPQIFKVDYLDIIQVEINQPLTVNLLLSFILSSLRIKRWHWKEKSIWNLWKEVLNWNSFWRRQVYLTTKVNWIRSSSSSGVRQVVFRSDSYRNWPPLLRSRKLQLFLFTHYSLLSKISYSNPIYENYCLNLLALQIQNSSTTCQKSFIFQMLLPSKSIQPF